MQCVTYVKWKLALRPWCVASILLTIGNPGRNTWEFYGALHSKAALWERNHVTAFDTPTSAAFPGEWEFHHKGHKEHEGERQSGREVIKVPVTSSHVEGEMPRSESETPPGSQ